MNQYTPKENKERKSQLMLLHKSFALISVGLLVPRIYYKIVSKSPSLLPGTYIEQLAGRISHSLLYFFITFLPATGIGMGYYSGYGIPFFKLGKIPGSSTPSKETASQLFSL